MLCYCFFLLALFLSRDLLILIKCGEFNKDADFVNPCVSFVVPEVSMFVSSFVRTSARIFSLTSPFHRCCMVYLLQVKAVYLLANSSAGIRLVPSFSSFDTLVL